MVAKILQSYGVAQIPAPSAGLSSGDFLNHAVLGACMVMGLNVPSAIGDPITVVYAGIAEVPSASATTLAQGATAEIDSSSGLAVADTAGDFDIGKVVTAKTAGQTSVQILLNG
ncbi:DUF2190 family protein [Crateriforma conspicua]|uniref:DUF2190 domain-containing protein n=1 Tax=Crateriforma conspicua TaxID=2527996 RepID=A0A5C6FYM6_9PLAN|nr:DUF2190 family protein [Crateriforma conspicua]TWU66458.1 hypothetical protein V7x_20240 [Crateriforma conspicua]